MSGDRAESEVATQHAHPEEIAPWRCNACDDRFPSWEAFKQHLRESEECQMAVIQS